MATTTPPTASVAEPLVGDEQIINSVYQLTYRVVDAIALQEMRAMMYKLRDQYEARIVELQSQLDAAPLWDDDRIAWFAGKAASAWEARHIADAMRKVRDDMQARIAELQSQLDAARAGSEGTVTDG